MPNAPRNLIAFNVVNHEEVGADGRGLLFFLYFFLFFFTCLLFIHLRDKVKEVRGRRKGDGGNKSGCIRIKQVSLIIKSRLNAGFEGVDR